jgi:hypothetical protein
VAGATEDDIQIEFEDSDKPVALLKGLFFSQLNEETTEVEVLMADPYFKFDNDQVHFDSHLRVILSPEFRKWPVPHQQVLIGHNDMHYYQLEAAKQQMMMEQMQMAQLKGGAPTEAATPGGPIGPPGEQIPEQPTVPGASPVPVE